MSKLLSKKICDYNVMHCSKAQVIQYPLPVKPRPYVLLRAGSGQKLKKLQETRTGPVRVFEPAESMQGP